VDVAAYNQTDLPLTLCDSRALAFANNSFDYAVLSFVLHHTPKPERILQEALRVAPQVIVVENDVRGRWRGWLTKAIDSWPALRYGTPPCYIANTREEWLQLFHCFPVEIRILQEFSLEFGFFHNLTAELIRK
jgi:ubiquinone/menaquinone biosynthesis C-methylase UbiE